MEYYSAVKKNEIMLFAATWMDLEIIILSEVSQKERQIPYDITYSGISNATQMNISMKQKQTHRQREQTCGCQGWGGGEQWQREGLGVWD